ncbi:IS3 family transposase [Bosea sp. 2YAB26]|uniref:IS3 family transposase n=1 Tax=Bosea sp. 2YAB26 TaxID=3237478 RepID=UPI003F8E4020
MGQSYSTDLRERVAGLVEAEQSRRAALVETMARISDSFEAYGYRRMQGALRHRGLIVNHRRIRRPMRAHDLQPLTAPALYRHHRWRSRSADLPEPGEEYGPRRAEPALGRRHRLGSGPIN